MCFGKRAGDENLNENFTFLAVCSQGAEESYLTVMLAKFIAQIDLVLNSKQ